VADSPELTVVIPCFNDGDYLRASLKSVLAQTLPASQVLVIDDGSTEPRTINFLRRLSLPTVAVIHQNNRGLAAARNTGIRHARGRYIYFVDADDVIVPDCLSTLTLMMESRGTALAATSAVRIVGGAEHGKIWGSASNPYEILVKNQWAAGIMLRKEAIAHHNLWYDESLRAGYEDWEFNIRLMQIVGSILFCPEPLYEYHKRAASLLETSRLSHVEIVHAIRKKHADLYDFNNLVRLKRTFLPALAFSSSDGDRASLFQWAKALSFCDWIDGERDSANRDPTYRLWFYSADASARLPAEAVEAALMALECYSQINHCIVAVRQGCPSLFATSTHATGLQGHRYPVAIITRSGVAGPVKTPADLLGDCELLLEFVDQRPGSQAHWDPAGVRFVSGQKAALAAGPDAFRKNLSSMAKKLLGEDLHRLGVKFYDGLYYRFLCSDALLACRDRVRTSLGSATEQTCAALLYGLFLTRPPDQKTLAARRKPPRLQDAAAPLFIRPPDPRVHVLIATAWLIEGGVEQIIFDLCRLLDPSRFRVTIVTTLPSHHSWDEEARKIGAAVYHLADFLRPSDMVKGILHIVLNHDVDCLYIMNSEAAYRAAQRVKHVAPWVPIIDRLEAPDPGGGYPRLSAKVGRQFIDLRTVSHWKLAELMIREYQIRQEQLRVIYIGVNTRRIQEIARQPRGQLQQLCESTDGKPIVLFVGRLANQKRPDLFIRSVAKMLQLNAGCRASFAMVGDGHLMPAVKELILKHKLSDRIHVLGAHPRAADLIADATVVMLPSEYEGVALVSYEAMALGIPQIVANVGGQSELLTAQAGVLIDHGPGEEMAYANACLALLADPERRAQMAQAGKERIRTHFTAEHAVEEYAGIFEEMSELGRKRAAETPHLRPPHIDPLRALP
jgi:glycosyltransferase involved in cell wall biosynthesis